MVSFSLRDQRQRLAVTLVAHVPLLQAAPPLQSALVVQEQMPLVLQVEVAPLGTGQFASVEQVPPVMLQVPPWQELPSQSAFVAQVRCGRLYVAVQSAADFVQAPLLQV